MGQRRPSYTIRASRHSDDMVLRYLKSLTVRPAVSWALAPLKGGLRHHDWAGFTTCTHLFRFADSYVLNKQSGPPCNCNLLSPFYLSTKDKYRHHLFRSYVASLPISLSSFYLTCLSLLNQSTCVGSRYRFLHPTMIFTGSKIQQI